MYTFGVKLCSFFFTSLFNIGYILWTVFLVFSLCSLLVLFFFLLLWFDYLRLFVSLCCVPFPALVPRTPARVSRYLFSHLLMNLAIFAQNFYLYLSKFYCFHYEAICCYFIPMPLYVIFLCVVYVCVCVPVCTCVILRRTFPV